MAIFASFYWFFLTFQPDPVIEWSPDIISKAAKEIDPAVGCVIACADFYVSYIKTLKALTYLNNPSVIFLATNLEERHCYLNNIISPGEGAFVQFLSTASRRNPIVVGKPEKYMFEIVKKKFPNIKPEKTLMIGDK